MSAVLASALLAATLGFSVPGADAAVPQFSASLAGANEAPGPGDPGATGDAQVSIEGPTSICYSIEFFGLASNATAAHIHVGAAGTPGPVVIPLTVPAATSGESNACTTAATALVSQIVSNPSGFYVNIHSTTFPAGALRGQLQAPTADPSPTTLSFGSAGAPIPQGALSSPQVVTVTNNGAAPLVISGIVFGGSNPDDFTVGSDTCHAPIAAGASCTVQVRFAPQAQGSRAATLTVLSDAPSSMPISLQGTAGPPPQGPPGTRGPAGSQGKPGQIELVTCTTVTVKVHKHKVSRQKCVSKVVSGTVTFTIAGVARASLVRRGVLYATGTASRAGLLLHARRTVHAGRYTLRLSYRHARQLITTSADLTID